MTHPGPAGPRWWHLLLAGMACLGCCAMPAITGAGIVAGGAATVLGRWLPAAAIVLAAGLLLLFGTHMRGRRRNGDHASGGEPAPHRSEPLTRPAERVRR
ncbi:MAG TPA: hypothetical protein VFX70_22555 [Mycobacteriales bacterium]|nr:hypothetical protein [Mycobacteriales bacterium]